MPTHDLQRMSPPPKKVDFRIEKALIWAKNMISPLIQSPKEAARPPRVLIALLVLVPLAVYGRVCSHSFLTWDDPQNVVGNHRVNPPTWRGVGESWRHPYWGLYIPVAYTFFAAEAVIAQRQGADGEAASLNPAVFHAGSLLLHVACGLLVYAILRRLLALPRPR